MDPRINETLQTGAVSNQRKRENGKTRKRDTFGRHCFQQCLCGAVGNRTYRFGLNAVRLETAPTGPDKSGLKPRSESVFLFLEFTIN